jgi:hypothetical protein
MRPRTLPLEVEEEVTRLHLVTPQVKAGDLVGVEPLPLVEGLELRVKETMDLQVLERVFLAKEVAVAVREPLVQYQLEVQELPRTQAG